MWIKLIVFVVWCTGIIVYGNTIRIPGVGTIIGSTTQTAWTNQTIYQFLGIKYAKSPSGELRYKYPIPWVTGYESIIMANKHGRSCPSYEELQHLNGTQLNNVDIEDCLHMSIYTKNITANAPCLVYIHGGALRIGGSIDFPPNYLLERDIVFIAIDFRQGPLGFVSTQTDDIPGNAGLLDILLALQYIKAYISYFGGDPNAITLCGHSSGAAIVSALILSPNIPENLFHRAILQSGTYFSPFAYETNPVEKARDFLQHTYNCSTQQDGSVGQMNRCLRELKPYELLRAYNEFNIDQILNGKSVGISTKLVRSPILPISPAECLATYAKVKNISLMAGVTKHDGSWVITRVLNYYNKTIGFNNATFNTYQLFEQILNNYYGLRDQTGTMQFFLEKYLFDNGATVASGNVSQMLNAIKDISGVVGNKAPILQQVRLTARDYPLQTYLYSFDYLGEHTKWSDLIKESPHTQNEIHHGDELIYLFPDFQLNSKDTKIAKMMVDLWTSFVQTGQPKSSRVFNWPPFTKFSGPYLHIAEKPWIGDNFLNEFSTTSGHETKFTQSKSLAGDSLTTVTSTATKIMMIIVLGINFVYYLI